MAVMSALIGSSTVIRHVQHLVTKVAETEAPVLITGEPGTGKEAVARTIHERSPRSTGPFVLMKCTAIMEDLLESELFGHEAGAFAGAHQARQGRFELASGGTLFLDEVSRLSAKLQENLLNVLQTGFVTPIGSDKKIPVNVRVICSTNANIDMIVREKQFSEELYYRLAACAVYVPPLRERREDIPALIEHFIQSYSNAKGKSIYGISPDAMTALLQHVWPNNIRELENLIERIVVLKNSGSIEVCDLPPRLRNLVTDNIDNFYQKTPINRALAENNAPHSAPLRPLGYSSSNSSMSNNSANSSQNNNLRNNPASYNRPSQSPFSSNFSGNSGSYPSMNAPSFEENGEIDQFIKKEIDLGNGIDFYRVVEEFENRLISEALRRTNHNKNRAAQLLAMNRTTLVEKLKKRAASSPVKVESGRVKRNSAFTIFDGLGSSTPAYDTSSFLRTSNLDNDNLSDQE